jgi:hypothetical protein
MRGGLLASLSLVAMCVWVLVPASTVAASVGLDLVCSLEEANNLAEESGVAECRGQIDDFVEAPAFAMLNP